MMRASTGSAGIPPPESLALAAVLTDLLTTALDDLGRAWNEEPREQAGSDPLDGGGQPSSSS
jgi:hypothetical protein